MRWVAASAAVLVLSVGAPGVAWAAPAGCAAGPAAAVVARGVPWEAGVYGPRRLARLATGAGVRVAVLDSGVDAGHPQLAGVVAAGRDVLRGGDARVDCVGHGTGVASVIAARAVPGSGMRGLAPGVTVVPVRVTERAGGDGGEPVSPARLAEAIGWAADPAGGDADVINLSVVMTVDDPAVRRAVAAAVGAGVVVVAAAGNGGPVPYPAAYPGVIGVGAVGADGVRASFSQRGPWVDLVAAGAGVTVAVPGGGHAVRQGTSYAAPFVAAAAALVLQRFPGSGPAQVRQRLVATADPAPGGDGYGAGLLNPYRALAESPPPPVAPVARVTVFPADAAVAARRAERSATGGRAVLVAGAAAAGAVLLVLAAGVRRRVRSG